MLKRLYVDNYKCLVNFELFLDPTTLLAGLNGTGKSTIFDLLEKLRVFVAGETSLGDNFPSDSITHWQRSNMQTFELTVTGGPDGTVEDYQYLLKLEHDQARERCRVRSEIVQTHSDLLFRFRDGEIELFRDDRSAGPKFPFDWSRSGLVAVVERHDNTRLSWFKRWLRDVYIVRLDPALMQSRGEREVIHPNKNMSDFACWYRHLMQERPREISELFKSLNQVFDGFSALELLQDAETARTLKVRFEASVREDEPRKSFQLGFQELSDGQRALVALYTLLHVAKSQPTTLCLDEPDNFVALAEIQPLIFEFCDVADGNGSQVIFASHHPEIIDHPGISGKFLLGRDNGGPTRITPLKQGIMADLLPSEAIARGWYHG